MDPSKFLASPPNENSKFAPQSSLVIITEVKKVQNWIRNMNHKAQGYSNLLLLFFYGLCTDSPPYAHTVFYTNIMPKTLYIKIHSSVTK